VNEDLLGRLAAANPVPAGTDGDLDRLYARIVAARTAPSRSRRSRRWPIAVALAAAVAVPAAAFGHRLGEALGLTNQGTPVATDELRESRDTKLAEAMRELQFPGQMQLLGERDGVTFYATRNADGAFCFAIDGGGPDVTPTSPRGVGCAPAGFPSPDRPIMGFPVIGPGGATPEHSPFLQFLAGFAADGVARVDLVDGNGATIVSAPVVDNLYAATDIPHVAVAAIVAYDADGQVVYRKELQR
jgi:hypothetical protein